MRIDAGATWLKPRPESEIVPSGATLLKVSAIPESRFRPVQQPVLVRGRRRIARMASVFNSLSLAQPVGFPAPCPASLDASLRFAFYRRGAPLAVARYETFCGGGVELDIGGRLEPELSPGVEFLSQVSAAIHTKLTTAVREPSRAPRHR
jgi:hypothetical protein